MLANIFLFHRVMRELAIRTLIKETLKKECEGAVSVLPSSTQFRYIGSEYSGFAIIIAIDLRNPMLNRNQAQILFCRMFFDLLDDAVTGY